jgi:hypothetical protein
MKFVSKHSYLTKRQLPFLKLLKYFVLEIGDVSKCKLIESPYTMLHPEGSGLNKCYIQKLVVSNFNEKQIRSSLLNRFVKPLLTHWFTVTMNMREQKPTLKLTMIKLLLKVSVCPFPPFPLMM